MQNTRRTVLEKQLLRRGYAMVGADWLGWLVWDCSRRCIAAGDGYTMRVADVKAWLRQRTA